MIAVLFTALCACLAAFSIGFSAGEKKRLKEVHKTLNNVFVQDEHRSALDRLSHLIGSEHRFDSNICSAIGVFILVAFVFFVDLLGFRMESMENLRSGKYRIEERVNTETRDGGIVKSDTTYHFYKVKK